MEAVAAIAVLVVLWGVVRALVGWATPPAAAPSDPEPPSEEQEPPGPARLRALGFAQQADGTWVRGTWSARFDGQRLCLTRAVQGASGIAVGPVDAGGPVGWLEVPFDDASVYVRSGSDLARLDPVVLDLLGTAARTFDLRLDGGRATLWSGLILDVVDPIEHAERVLWRLERVPEAGGLEAMALGRGPHAVLAARLLLDEAPERASELLDHPFATVRAVAAIHARDWERALPALTDLKVAYDVRRWGLDRVARDLQGGDLALAEAVLSHGGLPVRVRALAALATGRVTLLPDLWLVADDHDLWQRVWDAEVRAGQVAVSVTRCLLEGPRGLEPLLERPPVASVLDAVRGAIAEATLQPGSVAMGLRLLVLGGPDGDSARAARAVAERDPDLLDAVVHALGAVGAVADVAWLRGLPASAEGTAAIAAIQERAGGVPGAVSVAEDGAGGVSVARGSRGQLTEG